nr:hypothetical protein [Tanacetum cinerariifolium]
MILESVLNGPLVWPTIVYEDGTTRTKKYEELLVTKKLQADCDLKATNIVLQSLLPDVYAIVNHHKFAKEIWDIVKLLMQGTKLLLQEREFKLYDEFDKFSFVKDETLYQYYWRFSQLINNINVINMSMRPIQVMDFLSAVAALRFPSRQQGYCATGLKEAKTKLCCVISSQHAVIPMIDDEETLILEEAPRELLKVSLVNTSLKNLKYHLGKFDTMVNKWITPDAITKGEWRDVQT